LLLWFLGSPATAAEPLRVVASFPVLADIAARVGGDRVRVSSLVGRNAAPHGWSPKPQDVRRLAGADLVVVNGLGLEGWLDRLVAASGYQGPVLAASRDVMPLSDESGAPDPHAWHSPAEAGRYAAAIADALARLAPEDAPAFRANLAAFQGELAELTAWAGSAAAAIPAERRIVVTTHDAFAYLGRDLGIRVLSPAGLDSAAQPSARRMAELVAEIRAAGVKAVFLEAGGDGRMARTLAAEAGVAVGPPLHAGTLSGPDGPAPDYPAMWRRNVTLMLDAMGR
jgi:zinc/manganese transport system substrate-binding protein